jgi:hypothetical protein
MQSTSKSETRCSPREEVKQEKEVRDEEEVVH